MSKRENDGEINEEKLKHQKLNDADPSGIAAAAVDGNKGPLSPIYKLDGICCDDLFEWLSLEDLHSLGQTCKWMQQLTGCYFQENFKELISYESGNIYYRTFGINYIQINGFIKFIQKICFSKFNKGDDFLYIGANCKSLREICFGNIVLTKATKGYIKDRLANIETVRWISTHERLSNKLFEHFSINNSCPNLRTLEVFCGESVDENKWMHHHYPKLEHLKIKNGKPHVMQDFEVFIQKNGQLQSIELYFDFLRLIWSTFITSDVKLNVLIINCRWLFAKDFDCFFTILNQLYEKGFYNRLELEEFPICSLFEQMTPIHMKQIGELHGLDKLSAKFRRRVFRTIVLPTITGLKTLLICNAPCNNEILEDVTVSFPNLCQIYLCAVSARQMVIFIRRLPKLKKIFIEKFYENKYYLDLPRLHKERKKLAGACKLTIYLPENYYLKIKMATKNLYANHDLIEIKRKVSRYMEDFFDC